jgi:hypothetical protein
LPSWLRNSIYDSLLSSEWIRGGFAGECEARFILKPADFGLLVKGNKNFLHRKYLEMFSCIFYAKLHKKPKDCSVLILEHIFNPKTIREIIFSVLLQDLQVEKIDFLIIIFLKFFHLSCIGQGNMFSAITHSPHFSRWMQYRLYRRYRI